jgi:hypothetical protein
MVFPSFSMQIHSAVLDKKNEALCFKLCNLGDKLYWERLRTNVREGNMIACEIKLLYVFLFRGDDTMFETS